MKRAVQIPVFVLVRPRAGDFVYSTAELTTIRRAIDSAIDSGADGIVTGALTREQRVDIHATQGFVEAARDLPVTFHRGFDHVHDRVEALKHLIELGVTRILTSGGAATAREAAESIAELVREAGKRVQIVAGGGVRAYNVADLLTRSRVREVHARLVDEVGMRELVDVVRGYDSGRT